jgi:phytoene dehydrogenase-like protein
MPDVVIVGSGPNGLAAAVTMARAGLDVQVYEGAGSIGGGARTSELMEPGHLHDICSAVHPMALASPFFRAFQLDRRAEFVIPELAFGNPLDGGRVALAFRSLDRTVQGLGIDGPSYRRLMAPLVERLDGLLDVTMNQLYRLPKDPVAAIRLAVATLDQGTPLWSRRFSEDLAPALITGTIAHAVSGLPSLTASGAGLMLTALAHAVGWPIPVGGSASIVRAMADDLQAHGGKIETGVQVTSLEQLGPAKAVLLDVAPQGLLAMGRHRLPDAYARRLERFRYGNAAFKVDYILSEPVPWAEAVLSDAATVHVGGSRAETAAAENAVAAGRHSDKPYVLVSQPSRFDPSRAPQGRHILWAYCHAPAGSHTDMTEELTAQIERFAPGFRDVVVSSHPTTAAGLAAYNPNYVGGDFAAGVMDVRGLLQRPVVSRVPWRTPLRGVYLCSSSTPPGPGVTGMPGYLAAKYALKDIFGLPVPALGIGA